MVKKGGRLRAKETQDVMHPIIVVLALHIPIVSMRFFVLIFVALSRSRLISYAVRYLI